MSNPGQALGARGGDNDFLKFIKICNIHIPHSDKNFGHELDFFFFFFFFFFLNSYILVLKNMYQQNLTFASYGGVRMIYLSNLLPDRI